VNASHCYKGRKKRNRKPATIAIAATFYESAKRMVRDGLRNKYRHERSPWRKWAEASHIRYGYADVFARASEIIKARD